MYGSCKKIIEKIKENYSIEIYTKISGKPYDKSKSISIDVFSNIMFDFYKYKRYKFEIKDIHEDTRVGLIIITNEPLILKDSAGENIIENRIYIDLLKRYSKKHKGAIKDVLYAIICKAIKVNASIYFHALPAYGKKENPEKLYNYYNKIGFKRNIAPLKQWLVLPDYIRYSLSTTQLPLLKAWLEQNVIIPDTILYSTRVNNLKKIVNTARCIGRFCRTRKQKNR